MITDACPWGFAGVKYENHQPVAWFTVGSPGISTFPRSSGGLSAQHNVGSVGAVGGCPDLATRYQGTCQSALGFLVSVTQHGQNGQLLSRAQLDCSGTGSSLRLGAVQDRLCDPCSGNR